MLINCQSSTWPHAEQATTFGGWWMLIVAESPQEWLSWGDRRDFSQQCDQRLQDTGEMYVGTGGEGTRNWTQNSACFTSSKVHPYRTPERKLTSDYHLSSVNLKRGKLLEAEGCGSHDKRHWAGAILDQRMFYMVKSNHLLFPFREAQDVTNPPLCWHYKGRLIISRSYDIKQKLVGLVSQLADPGCQSMRKMAMWQRTIGLLSAANMQLSLCRSGTVPTVVWLLLKLWFESGLPSFLPVRTCPQVYIFLTAI